jgi:SAM-dependent methyltransferase
MDDLTQQYYATHALELSDLYDSPRTGMEYALRRAFVAGMRVLDIGIGSGQDMRLLQQLSCDVYGVEPSDELRDLTLKRHPELGGRLEVGTLPSLGLPFGGNFDGVFCSAALAHLPRAAIIDAAIAIRDILKNNGRLFVSIPIEQPNVDENSQDTDGRIYTTFQPDYFQLLFERLGFLPLERWESSGGPRRGEHSWCNFLFLVRHSGVSRPLDLIEGILNRDKKTATYKLALFRALSEIAITSFEQARWLKGGVVGVSIDAVCERWLNYYW